MVVKILKPMGWLVNRKFVVLILSQANAEKGI